MEENKNYKLTDYKKKKNLIHDKMQNIFKIQGKYSPQKNLQNYEQYLQNIYTI